MAHHESVGSCRCARPTRRSHEAAHQPALHRRFRWGVRGDVEVVVGEPIVFAAETDFDVATQQIQAAVVAL